MKKITLWVLFALLVAGTATAQKNYIRLGGGGGIGLGQYAGYEWANNTTDNATDVYEFKSMGLGSGLNVNLAFGHMTSDHFGLELGVNEFIGLNRTTTSKSTSNSSSWESETKWSGKMLQLVPAMVLSAGLEKMNPYGRLGMIIGILPSLTEKYEGTSNYEGGTYKETHKYTSKAKISGGVALGFTAAGGVTYNLGKKLQLYVELVYNGVTWSPKKGKYTEMTLDGTDQLPDATTRDKEWTFEKKIDDDETIPESSPDKYPKYSLNFSNVELNAGLKLKL